jgi:hypothetical protein
MVFEYFDLHILLSLTFQKFSVLLEEETQRRIDRIVTNITEIIIIIIIIITIEELYSVIHIVT